MGTDLAHRVLARPNALTPTLTLAPRVARSLARFYEAGGFNQDLTGWVVNNVTSLGTCGNFCWRAGFNPRSRIPSFPNTCGNPEC